MKFNKNVVLGFVIVVSSLLMFSGIALGKILVTNNVNYGNDPIFYKTIGDEMVRQGKISEAIKSYEASLNLKDDKDVRNNLAVLYYQSNSYNEAIEQLRVLIINEPNSANHHYDLAVNLVDKFRNTEDKNIEDLYEALAEYETSEKLSPGFENAQKNIEVLKQVLEIK